MTTTNELSPDPPRALLVATERRMGQADRSLEELAQLVRTIGMVPVDAVVQRRLAPHQLTFVGKGKVLELARRLAAGDVDTLVFNGELSPKQASALAERLPGRILDRTEVILEIFSQHAHTAEGKLQVELARAHYELPRLRGIGQEASQIAGGRTAAGMGVRGPGESGLELDRRAVRRRMQRLERRLEEVGRRREIERGERQRSGMLLVGLVGYTNAGKSSLQNALAGSAVASVNDRLFETLDTSIRRVDLGERTEALISDTVGFINDLPTELVSAFRATLEETVQADLLVEVLDAADPLSEDQHETVDKVLKDLGIRADKPRLLALNKWDLTPEERRRELVRRFPGALPLSAVTGEGVDELREELRRLLSLDLVPLTVRLPYNRLELLHIPPGQGRLISTSYEYEDVVAKVRVHPRLIERLRPFVVSEP
jgi:GTP-binding protein HflX